MKRNSKLIGLFALGLVLMFFVQCPPPEPPAPTLPYEALGPTAANISRFNTKFKYTMIVPEPAAKPEANGSPSTFYPYTLTTTAGTPSMIAPSIFLEESIDGSSDVPTDGVYSAAQKRCDLFMRETENQTLANQAQLLSLAPSGIDKAVPASPVVGTTWNNVYIATSGGTINTTCRYISTYAYFFVDNRDTTAMSTLLAGYGTAFDAIYTMNRTRFGNDTDTDGSTRVYIVFSQELSGGLLGYFYSVDKYPYNASTNPYSNDGDLFYITAVGAYQTYVTGTLAHEFQHMIYFDRHASYGVTSTFSWLNEALSQVAEYYNGYTANHFAWIASYLNGGWPGLSLTHWTSSNYGYGAVWIRYMRDRFGDTAIKNMCSTALVGVAAVESATATNFNTSFNDFSRAIVMSGTGDSTDPKYTFTTLNLQTVQPAGRGGLTTTSSYTSGATISSGGLYPYRIFFAAWTGNFGTMTLTGTDVAGTAFGLSR